jgi:RNA polymerase sigma factor (sigma-70 family)
VGLYFNLGARASRMPPVPPQGLLQELQELGRDLRRFLVARTGSEADADDLLIELWIRLSTAPTGPVSNPRSYIFRTANNLVLDKLREARRRERRESVWTADQIGSEIASLEVADSAGNAERMLIEQEEADRLARAIEKLPRAAQRVLRMHKLDGLSHSEVADRLGISKSAVEKHMAVAMKHLRRLLES